MVTPAAKREAVAHLKSVHEMSERRTCRAIGCQRMTVRYSRRRPDDPGCAIGLWHWHGNVADSATGAC
jgi:putative transposase